MPAPGTGDREVWGNRLPARQPIDRSEFGYANQHQSNVSLIRGKSTPSGGSSWKDTWRRCYGVLHDLICAMML